MHRRQFLVRTGLVAAVAGTSGCALVFDGAKSPGEQDRSRILWGYVILDILLTGAIGLIIDFISGAIYARKGSYTGPGMVAELSLCDEAHLAMMGDMRPRHAKRFFAAHLQSCPHCSLAVAEVPDNGTIDMDSVCRGRGEIDAEPVLVDLAHGGACPA